MDESSGDNEFLYESFSPYVALKCHVLKFALNGADRVFMDRNARKRNSSRSSFSQLAMPHSHSKDCHCYASCGFEEIERVTAKNYADEQEFGGNSSRWNDEYIDVSEVVNSPPAGYITEFPFNILTFFAVLLLKFTGFQFNLLVSFFTFPIWLSYFSITFLLFPFQTLRRLRGYFVKKLLRWWGVSSRRVTEKAQKSLGELAMKFTCALFWSSYVCLMLLGLLASGFLFGSLVMRHLLVKPIQTTETLIFDYTKDSPVAYVPIVPYSGVLDPSFKAGKDNVQSGKQAGPRVIPHNHKLQLTVSLVMPESEYNRNLGIFQVRVEFLSGNGKVTAGSSHPCMLRFKSQPIRFVESIISSFPLIAGLQSESQLVNIKMEEFTEGVEPTAFLKVILEQRAEYKSGAGIPEVYAASLSLESELPQLRRFIWEWRRTFLVWISIVLFLTELMLVLVFCRPILIPKGRIFYDKKKTGSNFISWYKMA